jgi:hypothetical protein
VIESGWLYATGDAPCVGTKSVVAQAEGCKLILYYYTPSGSAPRCRVCYLEGNPDHLVLLYRRDQQNPEPRYLTVGTIGEMIVDGSGYFVDWADSENRFRHPIDGLPDTDNYWSVLQEVDEYRYENQID